LDALVTFTPDQLAQLRTDVTQYVLATLRSQQFEPGSVKVDPPLFRLVLQSFSVVSQKGEPTGAAYQGIVFGFLRADNPHLQVEIDKVRTGSKRLQRVGDIDCWEGARLAISAEVKQYILKTGAVPDLEGFGNETGRRGALGLVIALGFEEGVKGDIEALGVKALDRDDLLRIVELWDPLKQRTAVQSLVYYVQHVEKNSFLSERVAAFLDQAEEASAKTAPRPMLLLSNNRTYAAALALAGLRIARASESPSGPAPSFGSEPSALSAVSCRNHSFRASA
jgi:hypothetical protein